MPGPTMLEWLLEVGVDAPGSRGVAAAAAAASGGIRSGISPRLGKGDAGQQHGKAKKDAAAGQVRGSAGGTSGVGGMSSAGCVGETGGAGDGGGTDGICDAGGVGGARYSEVVRDKTS